MRAVSSCSHRTRRRSASRATAAGSGSSPTPAGAGDGTATRPNSTVPLASPMRGASRASTTGSRSISSAIGTPSAWAWATADSASDAPVTDAAAELGMRSPAIASCPCRLASVRRPLRRIATSSWLASSSSAGTADRSASTRPMRSVASSTNALRSRPTRHAARRRRAGGRGSSRRRMPPAAGSTPRARRSAAAMPWTATTIGLRSRVRAGIEPVSRRAARRPSRMGDSHRSCSSGASGAGNDSATGPGPNTVPRSGPIVVIGRACSRWR